MVRRIKKFFSDENKETKKKPRKFTYMLIKDDVGKSIVIKAENQPKAEQELKEMYPGFSIQFLWEWN